MTIAQQLELNGRREEAIRIARLLIEQGVDKALVIQVTGVDEEDLMQVSQ